MSSLPATPAALDARPKYGANAPTLSCSGETVRERVCGRPKISLQVHPHPPPSIGHRARCVRGKLTFLSEFHAKPISFRVFSRYDLNYIDFSCAYGITPALPLHSKGKPGFAQVDGLSTERM